VSEVGVDNGGVSEVGVGERGVGELSGGKDGAGEVGADKDGVGEDGAVRYARVRLASVRSTRVRVAPVKSARVRSARVRVKIPKAPMARSPDGYTRFRVRLLLHILSADGHSRPCRRSDTRSDPGCANRALALGSTVTRRGAPGNGGG
jgi:hypothetical protein